MLQLLSVDTNITNFSAKGYSPNSTVMEKQYNFERDAQWTLTLRILFQ